MGAGKIDHSQWRIAEITHQITINHLRITQNLAGFEPDFFAIRTAYLI